MTTEAFDLSHRLQPAPMRAGPPTLIDVRPEVVGALIITAGSIVMAVAGVGAALYLMLPFGA